MTRVSRPLSPIAALLASALVAGCAPNGPHQATSAQPAADTMAFPDALATNDPIAVSLTLYLRLLEPGGGTPEELAGFLSAHPGWPNRPLLRRRLDQALANDTDPASLSRLCPTADLSTAASLARCASQGRTPTLVIAARHAWVHGIDTPDQEADFFSTWRDVLTASDQQQRFARLESSGRLDAANRTLPLLPAADRAAASAMLALRNNAVDADSQAATVPPPGSNDPALLLDLARWLRRNDRVDAALALWRDRAPAVEANATEAQQTAFWIERDAFARALLDQRRDADALLVAADPTASLPAGPRLDADFLTGWISLRRLNDPVAAEARFASLTGAASVISHTRGAYWTGRARLARGDTAGARAAFEQAAASPTSFYGQLAAARLQPGPAPAILLDPASARTVLADRFAALRPPTWTPEQAIRFAGLDLARAAELLVAWNDPRHARAFLLALDPTLAADSDHALNAALADRLGLPDVAVAIARNAGRHGLVLAATGWPRPVSPPDGPVPPALVLAVMRQESSFDPRIVSPAGADGLMQLTPGTARDVARQIGRPNLADSRVALFDPQTNMTLGSAYLASLLARFGGVVPYALAGYNAGPHRADRWLTQYGDPARAPGPSRDAPDHARDDALLDWIETIPFQETRNYVERVMENQMIYQAPPL